MPQATNIQNNFVGGLKTEFTGLNFPENACTDTDNCVFSVLGDISRRGGFDLETNGTFSGAFNKTNCALSSFKWDNAGGDGTTKILVQQIGNYLLFYRSSSATAVNPLSQQFLSSVYMGDFLSQGALDPDKHECQYATGNGYLFVFNPSLEPFYCTYNSGSITANKITILVRDVYGLPEPGVSDTFRSTSLTTTHNYNLINQGWTNAAAWSTSSSSFIILSLGNQTFTVAGGLSITPGDIASISSTSATVGGGTGTASGIVVSYVGTTLIINVTSISYGGTGAIISNSWNIYKSSGALISKWNTDVGNFPSNSDVWWRFKNSSGVFAPATTYANTTLNQSPAPKGAIIFNTFVQNRRTPSQLAIANDVHTSARPRTGTWFQGRVWYAGADGSYAATSDTPSYTWSENIYFSQIVNTAADFGLCYQTNDPTSEDLFDLLPSDGGVITIQNCGSIYKLFPIQNGLLVFAANGIWFITGSQGIGFTANDYTITKISSVKALSGSSFINVLGFPLFWNEEGIYSVTPGQQGGLEVTNLCLGTIASFYETIPLQSKLLARGDYNPITFVVSWVYKADPEPSYDFVYDFDRVLNFNTANKAFYPYSINTGVDQPHLHDVKYIVGEGGVGSAASTFKYFSSVSDNTFFFSEENDFTNWKDFVTYENRFGQVGLSFDYESFFVTGYNLRGKAILKWQPLYITVFSNGEQNTAYKIQSIWDYATSGNSGRYSSEQLITNAQTNFGILYRRHKLRGRGIAMQIRVSSVSGLPFNLIGWADLDTINSSI